MSDSDDFGPLVANTPNIPRTIGSKPNGSRAAAAAEAGPSRMAAGTSNKRKKAASVVEELSDEDEVQEIAVKSSKGNGQANARGRRKQQQVEQEEVEEEEDEGKESGTNDVLEIDPPPPPMKQGGGSRKPASRSGGKPESSGLNGNSKARANAQSSAAAAKSQGKQKAKATTTGRAPNRYSAEDAEAMDVDAIEVPHDEVDGEDMEPEVLEENLVQAINTAARSGRVKPGTGKVVLAQPPSSPRKNEEVASLKEKLRQVQKHNDDLSQQLKELCQVRLTEPEQLLERMEVQHQAELHARDSLLQDYVSQSSKNNGHGRTGKTVMFELLTRDEVDKETQALQQQVRTLQEALREKDKLLQEQDEQIKSLKEDVSITKLELKEEIGRGRILLTQQQRQSAQSSRSRTVWNALSSSSDPKYGIIVSFYEDLTNVIVPTMKNQPGKYLNKDEWALNCCYTHKDVVNKDAGSTGKSLSFTLRLCWEPAPGVQEPIVDEQQLAQAVHYIPHELEHESPEFVQSLGFLGGKFTFERDQLSLFVRTLYDYIGGEGGEKADQTASDDDSVQVVE